MVLWIMFPFPPKWQKIIRTYLYTVLCTQWLVIPKLFLFFNHCLLWIGHWEAIELGPCSQLPLSWYVCMPLTHIFQGILVWHPPKKWMFMKMSKLRFSYVFPGKTPGFPVDVPLFPWFLQGALWVESPSRKESHEFTYDINRVKYIKYILYTNEI